MNRSNVAIAVVLGAALAGCQRAPQRAAASPSPSAVPQSTLASGQAVEPAPDALAPTPAGAAPSMAEDSAAPRAAAPRAAARPAAPHTTAARSTPPAPVRPTSRVDRTPAAEPIDTPAEASAAAAPRPAARAPEPERVTIPAGTELQLVLENELSSATSQVGDKVTARVTRATSPDGAIVLPGGTVLKGRVYRADAAGRVKGKSHLSVDFDRITIRGVEQRLDTTAIDVEGPDSHGRDAAIIGGSTVGGAIVGGILGGGSGAKKGAVVGAVGGTGAVLATRGKDVTIPSGSKWTVKVKTRTTM
jgi:hypothetical protein